MRDRLLANIFNALSAHKLNKTEKELTKLVKYYSSDTNIIKPVMLTLNELALQGKKSDAANLARTMAEKLPSDSFLGIKLIAEAIKLEQRPIKFPAWNPGIKTMSPNEFVEKIYRAPIL